MSVLTVLNNGIETRLETVPGALLSDALRLGGHPIALPCGGIGKCWRCRVRAGGALSAPDETERKALGEDLRTGVRLACLTRVEGDAVVCLSADSMSRGRMSILAGGQARAYPRAPIFRQYGVAVDIGTTTLAAQLCGPDGVLGETTEENPQSVFGADVISRVGAALEGKADELRSCVCEAVNRMAGRLCAGAGIRPRQVDVLAVTGNTAMLYLFCGQDPRPLSAAPFVADRLFGEFLPASELGVDAAPGARVYLPRCISAFVGGDITTAILASGMLESRRTALLADIGTNGELALWHEGKLTCCSTAAGPAFEAANIRMGLHGENGAIDAVRLRDGALDCHVIGGGDAKGICGSGVIDAVAALLELGAIDEGGALQTDDPRFAAFLGTLGEAAAFRLKGDVWLTGKDIRMVQLAKASIRAGIDILLEEAGLEPEQLDTLCLAGGFGNYLDLSSAAAIGLVPAALAEKALILGNAAQTGASMLLQNAPFLEETTRFADRAETLPLSESPAFFERYVEVMGFA